MWSPQMTLRTLFFLCGVERMGCGGRDLPCAWVWRRNPFRFRSDYRNGNKTAPGTLLFLCVSEGFCLFKNCPCLGEPSWHGEHDPRRSLSRAWVKGSSFAHLLLPFFFWGAVFSWSVTLGMASVHCMFTLWVRVCMGWVARAQLLSCGEGN